MPRSPLVVLGLLALSACTFQQPPPCAGETVDELLRQRLAENAAAVFEAKIDKRDPLSVVRLMGIGVGMYRGDKFVVPREVARQIEWQLSDQRTASLNSDLGIRACSAEVAYGMAPEVLGGFRIRYTVSRTDGGHASVELMD